MKMRALPALILFTASYFPLSAILIVQDIEERFWKLPLCNLGEAANCALPQLSNPSKSLGFFFLCGLSLALFATLINRLRGQTELKVAESKTIPNDLINYVFPYVVSFMSIDLSSDGKFLGFLIFIGLMFLITYRSGQILMNPLLLILGWQLYEMNIDTEGHRRSVRALCKAQVSPGDKLESCLIHGIYVLHKEKL